MQQLRKLLIDDITLKVAKVFDDKLSRYEVKCGYDFNFCCPLNLAGLLKLTKRVVEKCSYPPEFEEKINKEINLLMTLKVKNYLSEALKNSRRVEEVANFSHFMKKVIDIHYINISLNAIMGRLYVYIFNENKDKLRPTYPYENFLRIKENKQLEIYFTCMGIPGEVKEFPSKMTDKVMFYPLYEHESYPKKFEVEFDELVPIAKSRINKVWKEYLEKEGEHQL